MTEKKRTTAGPHFAGGGEGTDARVTADNPVSPSDTIRLILVDDEKGFADIIAKRMSKRNIRVTTAYSGAEAIQALRKEDFDLAVIDLKMEDMDGIEVLKIFKTMDPRISVIMLTGHGSEEAAKQGIEHGAFDYLTKPCDFEELLTKIRDAYRQRKRA